MDYLTTPLEHTEPLFSSITVIPDADLNQIKNLSKQLQHAATSPYSKNLLLSVGAPYKQLGLSLHQYKRELNIRAREDKCNSFTDIIHKLITKIKNLKLPTQFEDEYIEIYRIIIKMSHTLLIFTLNNIATFTLDEYKENLDLQKSVLTLLDKVAPNLDIQIEAEEFPLQYVLKTLVDKAYHVIRQLFFNWTLLIKEFSSNTMLYERSADNENGIVMADKIYEYLFLSNLNLSTTNNIDIVTKIKDLLSKVDTLTNTLKEITDAIILDNDKRNIEFKNVVSKAILDLSKNIIYYIKYHITLNEDRLSQQEISELTNQIATILQIPHNTSIYQIEIIIDLKLVDFFAANSN